MGRKRR